MRNTFFFGIITLAAGMLTACSDDMKAPGTDGVSDIETSGLKVTTDTEYLNQFVTNYKAARSRADEDDTLFDFKMPAQPSIPTTAKSLVGAPVADGTINLYKSDYGWNLFSETGEFVIPADATITENLNVAESGMKLYIQGSFEGQIIGNNAEIEIYLLDGGEWLNANNDVQPAWTIYKYPGGALDFSADITGAKGKIYADELITDKNIHFTNGSVLCVEELLKAANITFDSGALFTAHCVDGKDVYLTNGTDIYLSAYINAQNLKVDSQTKIHMRGAGFINVAKYLFCGNVSKSGDSDQFVNHGSEPCVISTDYYFAAGSNHGDGTCSLANNLVGAFDFYIKQGVVNTFKYYTPSALTDIDGQLGGLEIYAFDEVATAEGTSLISSGLDTPLYDSCTAAVKAQKRPEADPEPEPQPTLDVIAKVEMDHSHPISATCIDINGDQAYISWHERGDNMQGCIEILNVDPATQTVSFQAWMETPRWVKGSDANAEEAYDFNHLIYDSRTNSILTVGDHPKKSGFVGQIKADAITTGSAVGENLNCLIPRQLPIAASGNSIIRYGEDLYIAGAGGYSIFPFADGANFPKPVNATKDDDYTRLTDCTTLETDGSGKHLAINGNTIATIEYTTRTGDTRPAKISLWDATSWIKGESTISWPVPSFGPTDGKDVIALDNTFVYSCQGKNGVAIYDLTGNEVARFQVNDYLTKEQGFTDEQRNKMRNSAANGLYVHGDYVFVANGGAGIWVLSKATGFKPVAHFTDHNAYFSQEKQTEIGASANYVRVTDDGYVYVAYGLAGVMVLKFDQK